MSGTVMKNHLFWVHRNQPTVMFSKTFANDADHKIVTFNHYKHSGPNRLLSMALHEKVPLNRPGLKHIKVVALWKKWGQYVPDEFKAEICPRYVFKYLLFLFIVIS